MNSTNEQTIDLFKALTALVSLIFKHIRLIVLTFGLFIGASLLYFYTATRVYESKMILQSDILSESYSQKLAENLNNHIQSKDYNFLASRLNLSADQAHKLREFKLISALTPMSQQMNEREKTIVVISVRVTDNAILPKLQEGIIHYLSDNDYIRKRVTAKRQQYAMLLASVNKEIQRLDTLKNKISKGEFPGFKSSSTSVLDFAGLYTDAIKLYESRFNASMGLELVESIQVIEDLSPYDKPVWPKGSIIVAGALMLALIFSVVFIFLKSLIPITKPKAY